ncbi:villin headpiece, Villin/Gelsolin, ADF-H/Gelsolin-like domain protein [Artemisia annua]|uniref:Villin headpiece, Villin/Gelsolin, ADF-H/Gelsolin-like domain protein n=1 Tax=Artemisia annua TaxID=35608 RepID=A0A2U1PR18_ARTAN|nr:villin headpiece, Villin/Gelsolin, ADF-H/Gelsolin-like domain protein [Artemisia annua]
MASMGTRWLWLEQYSLKFGLLSVPVSANMLPMLGQMMISFNSYVMMKNIVGDKDAFGFGVAATTSYCVSMRYNTIKLDTQQYLGEAICPLSQILSNIWVKLFISKSGKKDVLGGGRYGLVRSSGVVNYTMLQGFLSRNQRIPRRVLLFFCENRLGCCLCCHLGCGPILLDKLLNAVIFKFRIKRENKVTLFKLPLTIYRSLSPAIIGQKPPIIPLNIDHHQLHQNRENIAENGGKESALLKQQQVVDQKEKKKNVPVTEEIVPPLLNSNGKLEVRSLDGGGKDSIEVIKVEVTISFFAIKTCELLHRISWDMTASLYKVLIRRDNAKMCHLANVLVAMCLYMLEALNVFIIIISDWPSVFIC